MINYDNLAGCDKIGAAGQHAVELGLRPEVRDDRLYTGHHCRLTFHFRNIFQARLLFTVHVIHNCIVLQHHSHNFVAFFTCNYWYLPSYKTYIIKYL